MIVLGIETTSKIGSLAIARGGIVLDEKIISEESHHSSGFIPTIKELTKSLGLSVQDIDGIGVSTGPGSFTGIRIGIAAGLGLSNSLHIPIVGIETMQVILNEYTGSDNEVCVTLDAGRGNMYARLFEKKRDHYLPVKDYLCGNPAQLIEYKREEVPVFGEKLFPHAGAVARLAHEKIVSGQTTETIKPLYVRPSYVDEMRRSQK